MTTPEALRNHPELQEMVEGPGYSEATEVQTLDSIRLELGRLTDASFENKFKRPTLWQVHGDTIEYYAPIELKKGEDSPPYESPADLRRYGVRVEHRITAEQLASFPIPEDAAKTLLIFKRVEDNLPWFSLNLFEEYPDVKGMVRSSSQWVREESEHSNAAGLILRSAPIMTAEGELKPPLMTKEDLDRDYDETQIKVWKPPLSGWIENGAAYPHKQERITNGNYFALESKIGEYGNIYAAYAVKRMGMDESWHGGSYRDTLIQIHKLLPDETIKAVTRSAWHFRMPSMALMRDRVRDTETVIRTTGYNKEQIERALRQSLISLPFYPREYIEPIVTGYFDEESSRVRKIMYGLIREKAKARKDAKNGSPSDSENNGSGTVLPRNGEIFSSQSGKGS